MRFIGDKIRGLNSEEIVIITEIPPIRVITVKVRYSPLDQKLYNDRYIVVVRQLDKTTRKRATPTLLGEENRDMLSITIMQELCLLGFNPFLGNFLRVIGGENILSEMASFER